MEFADEGGEGATPYEVLLLAAMIGDSTRFSRQDSVEETWRVMRPLLDTPPPVDIYEPGSLGPAAADALVAGTAAGTSPGCPGEPGAHSRATSPARVGRDDPVEVAQPSMRVGHSAADASGHLLEHGQEELARGEVGRSAVGGELHAVRATVSGVRAPVARGRGVRTA